MKTQLPLEPPYPQNSIGFSHAVIIVTSTSKYFLSADNEKLLHVRPAVWTLVVNLSTDKENTDAGKTLYQYEQQLQIKYLI